MRKIESLSLPLTISTGESTKAEQCSLASRALPRGGVAGQVYILKMGWAALLSGPFHFLSPINALELVEEPDAHAQPER